ncbi:MAG: hypothetical protein KF901_30450 [Myxococcales bacterium]|nr:hypothetical protein [Myxococcales bacterium]
MTVQDVSGREPIADVTLRITQHERPTELVFTGASLDADACHLVARLDRQLRVFETTLPCGLVPALTAPRCDLAVVAHASSADPTPGGSWLAAAVCDALAERLWQRGEHWEHDAAGEVLRDLRVWVQAEVERVRTRKGLDAERELSWAAVLVVASRGLLLGGGRVSTLALTRAGEARSAASGDGAIERVFDAQALHAALLAVGPTVSVLPERTLRGHLERDAAPEERLTAMAQALHAADVTRGGIIAGFFP